MASRSDCCKRGLETLLVVDVGRAADPGVDRPVRAAQRPGAECVPPEAAVVTVDAVLGLELGPVADRRAPAALGPLGVVRMDETGPAPLVVRRARPAGVLDTEVVDVGRRTIRRRHPHDVGDRVEHRMHGPPDARLAVGRRRPDERVAGDRDAARNLGTGHSWSRDAPAQLDDVGRASTDGSHCRQPLPRRPNRMPNTDRTRQSADSGWNGRDMDVRRRMVAGVRNSEFQHRLAAAAATPSCRRATSTPPSRPSAGTTCPCGLRSARAGACGELTVERDRPGPGDRRSDPVRERGTASAPPRPTTSTSTCRSSGQAVSRAGTAHQVVTRPGSAQVFMPGEPADLRWSDRHATALRDGQKTALERHLALCWAPISPGR